MRVVVIPFDRRLLDRPVHPFDLAVGPGVVHFCQPVIDVLLPTDAVEDVFEGRCVLLAIGELDAIARREEALFLGYGRLRSPQIAQRVAITGPQVSTVVLHEPH